MVRRAQSAPEHWLRNIRVSGFAVIMLGLLVLAIVVLAPNLKIYLEQRQQVAQLEAAVQRQHDSVDQLTADLARWDDPAYIEAEARDRLFFMYPGESTYLVIDDTGQSVTTQQAPITDRILTTRVDWLAGLLGSAFTAGLTDAPPDELPVPAGG